jgi:uncharacterized protein
LNIGELRRRDKRAGYGLYRGEVEQLHFGLPHAHEAHGALMPNRLAQETSPYLLQHQDNPVDWHPWGPEALARAKSEEKPIFLSIGYSACHWCHVMEHESFENPEIARQLNEKFVNIKVDREERPDLDHIYMNAVQLMTGRGGWPMSVFLTPDLQPFYGGTYWPPHDSRGMPGFDRIIAAVHDAWTNRRAQALEQAGQLTEAIRQVDSAEMSDAPLGPQLLHGALAKLERSFDSVYGGFGQAPKFPHSMDLQLLLRVWHRERRSEVLDMVRLSLDRMAAGGIYDHLGGGFARYSVDERWLVPHFEKMLYDNALLVLAYVEAYQATGEAKYADTARETIEYILRDMTDATGMFYSTEDADSEGVEGKFYVWTVAEIIELLGEERGQRFCYVYDVSDQGNFEHGTNILHLPNTIVQVALLRQWDPEQLKRELAEDRAKLYAARSRRVPPGKDDKVLTSWNGLMIDALARASIAFEEPRYLEAAKKGAEGILNHLRRPDGRLLHSWRHGQAKLDAYLDDYANFTNALVSLYEASFEELWITEAVALADVMLARFRDPAGGFFYTADDHEQLIARHKDLHDSSTPSGNSMAAYGLLRLGKLTGRSDFLEAAHGTLPVAMGFMERVPAAVAQMLLAADLAIGPTQEFVFVGPKEPTVLSARAKRFSPRTVTAWRELPSAASSPLDPLFTGRTAGPNGELALFICENSACQQPIQGASEIAGTLR